MVICPLCRSEHRLPNNGFFPTDITRVNLLEINSRSITTKPDVVICPICRSKHRNPDNGLLEIKSLSLTDKIGKKIYKVFRIMSGASCKQTKNILFHSLMQKNCFPL